jgi:hypothetical protein
MAPRTLEQMSQLVVTPHPFTTRFLFAPSISNHHPPFVINALPSFHFTRTKIVPRHRSAHVLACTVLSHPHSFASTHRCSYQDQQPSLTYFHLHLFDIICMRVRTRACAFGLMRTLMLMLNVTSPFNISLPYSCRDANVITVICSTCDTYCIGYFSPQFHAVEGSRDLVRFIL